ncbi:hypothetical protein [Aureimonas endophytica]|nr:hypothetical protein [Aureimonas endophytica]
MTTNESRNHPAAPERSVEAVRPEDERREDLRGEASAAQAVKDAARHRFRDEDEAAGTGARLMGLDAPGFGERSGEMPPPPAARPEGDQPARDAACVATEFDGMDNDLIDMSGFGEGGTGAGTETGGAGERLRPTSPAPRPDGGET